MIIANELKSITKTETGYILETDGPHVMLIFMTDDILRVRASYDCSFTEESYVLMTTAWEDRFDAMFARERRRISPLDLSYDESDEEVVFQTQTWKVSVSRKPFGLSIYNGDNECIHSDLKKRAFVRDRFGRVYHYQEFRPDRDCFYGFGETAGKINKAGRRLRMSPKDAIGYDAVVSDPLYKHIPFYIRLNRQTGHALGYFYHNTYESVFDMGCEISGYWKRYSYFRADGGDIDLFLIDGPEIRRVVERYTDLTGKTALPPLDALGHLGSTMYYGELPSDCDDAIVDYVDKCAEEGIPVDGFQLSSGYTVGDDNKRYVFTWNRKKFKDPDRFFQQMNDRGVTVSPNVKPGILTSHPYYRVFEEAGAFVGKADDAAPHVGQWWGGPGSFVDFTNPEARSIWRRYLNESLVKKGITSIWNDNCEYDGIDDRMASCRFDGGNGTIGQLKSVQANLMAQASRETIQKTFPEKRPFIICRSGFAGIQRLAQTWAGDNATGWETLQYNIGLILNMGLSGVANQGCDIGGFYGRRPEAELLVRWVQNGIFQPRFSIHSSNTDNTVTEPWMYRDHTRIIRDAVLFRYSLAPYLYSLMYEAHTVGSPIMRPLFYEFQDDVGCYEEGVHFMLGKGLLVANVTEKGAKTKTVYLPAGTNWYDWRSRKRYTGGREIEIPVDLAAIPMFIRGGGIIPLTRPIQNLKKRNIDYVKILIAPDRQADFQLYEDDGDTNRYQTGDFLKTNIEVIPGEKNIIDFRKEGPYPTAVKHMHLEVFNDRKGPYWVEVDGRILPQYLHRDKWERSEEGWYYSASKGAAEIKYANIEKDYQVVVSFEEFDLIGM